ncbi:MAG: GNAT family N-acetyltransferase [Cyanobacteria bacterium P01_F01_bin.4]
MPASGYSLRAATAKDIWPIRWLVLSAWLDPTQLRWSQFWVAEAEGKVIACGQLRQFEGAQELGSLVVARVWRGQGIGRRLTQQLINVALSMPGDSLPLYVECLGHALKRFYKKLGFIPVTVTDMPPAMQRKFSFTASVAARLRLPLYQMQYCAP